MLVSLSDSQNHRIEPTSAADTKPIFGDILALLSAVFYALYVIFLKIQIREESRIDMQLFFGFVGLFNIIGSWPIGVLLHLMNIEPFSMPRGRNVVAAVLINVSCYSSGVLAPDNVG